MKNLAQHTRKLHYGKYLYRITLYIPHVSWLRYSKQKEINSLYNSESYEEFLAKSSKRYKYSFITDDKWSKQRNRAVWNNRFIFYKLFNLIQEQKKINDFTVRLESDTIGFYLNSKELWETLCKQFKDYVDELSWPQEGTEHLLTKNIQIVKKYPYNMYKYKINLKRGIVNENVKNNFSDWIKQYPEFKTSDKTINAIERGYLNGNGKFLYSTNLKNVLLLQMFLGELTGNTTTYKLESEINGKQ